MAFNLNTLILDGCIGLIDLDLRFTGLNSLDVSTCVSLSTIDLFRSSNLQELDVSGMTSITSIMANESSLTSLNVVGCSSLATIRIDETSISTLDLRDNAALVSLDIFDAAIQVINLSNCVNFESITLSQCYDLQAIQHMNTTNLKSLTFANISPQINNLDLTSYPGLETIFLAGTSITSLDITLNPNITSISVYDSAINDMDLRNGNNTSISTFNAYGFDLGCVSVDDPVYSAANWTNIGANVFFSEDCETLSIEEFSQVQVVLYPNPSDDLIFLSGLEQSQNYQIFGVDGKRLNYGIINPNEGIAISNFSPGIYFLNLDGRTSFKFVKK